MRRWMSFAAMGVAAAMTAEIWQGQDVFEFPRTVATTAEFTQGDPLQQDKATPKPLSGGTLGRFANLNHLYITGGENPDSAEYFKASHVNSAVLDAIALWMQAPPATQRPVAGKSSGPGFPWLAALLKTTDLTPNCESTPVTPRGAWRDAIALDFSRRQRRCSTI